MNEIQFHQQTCYRLSTSCSADSSPKPLLVLIHGVGLNQDMWLPWLPILQENFSVLTFDLLGHGQSHNPAGERTEIDFAKQLSALLAHLAVDSFALVGFSLGALIAQTFAARHSEAGTNQGHGDAQRLTHLVLLHSVYQRNAEQRKAVYARYQITRERGPMATVEIAIERWFSASYRAANPEKMQQLRDMFSAHSDDGYLKAYALFCNAETAMQKQTLAHIHCPTLVITGAADVGSTPAMSAALARDLANAELIINPNQRHMAPTEFADMMANQVRSFLLC